MTLKTIFAVLAVDRPEAIAERIKTTYPEDHYALAPGQWLVAADGTAVTISEHLGITEDDPQRRTSSALVLSVASYYGRKPPALWEWIKSKWDRP